MTLLDALGGRSDVVITIDFETFYSADYGLKKLTTEAYVRDPRFEVIGVGVKFGDLPSVWLEEWEFREWARGVDWSRVSVVAHNAQFDAFIMSHHYGIRPRVILCTLSMARALHGVEVGGSLKILAEHYKIGVKGDEVSKVLGKRRADFTHTEWLRFGDYCNNDVELTYRLLSKLLLGFPTAELWTVDTTVRMFTEPVFEADLGVLERAHAAEKLKKAELLRRIAGHAGIRPGAGEEEVKATVREVLGSSDKFADVLRSLGVEPPTKPGKRGQIYAFAKTDPGMQTLLEDDRDDIRWLAEARLGVKSNIVETRTARMIACAKRGPVPFFLRYCGAHTHRWSGGDKMNPQNFNRGGALRAAILAPAGSTLAVADSGQIEARVVAWLAGQTDLIDTFRRNDATEDGDFYSDAGGATFYQRKLSKKETPNERQVCKALLLGLGFGMGWAKCAGELLKGMLGTPPVQFGTREAEQFGVNVASFENQHGGRVDELIKFGARLEYGALVGHSAVTDYFVRLYRRKYPKIPALWETMGAVIGMMARGERKRVGCLEVGPGTLTKPNGLVLRYPDLKRHANGEWTYQNGRKRSKIYGGLLTENVVQSLARDVVAEQILWIRADGLRVATCTHDEAVTVVPEAQGAAALETMIKRMRTPPAWCADLPLNAEGGFSRSYGDCK